MAPRFAAVVLALGISGTLSLAQPPRPPLDPLAETQARLKIADQKAESEVLNAMQDAQSLAKKNPAKAMQLLRAAQSNIDNSAAISNEARKNLTAMLTAR